MATGTAAAGHAVSRRALLAGAMLGATVGARATAARADSVNDPSMAGPLGDVWIGAPDAKVTFIEYAAVTCTHCAAFHAQVLPGIKARWIETGRMRFALRGFPLNPLDTAAFMLARADGGRTYYAITDLLFEKQASWAFVPKPVDAMRDLLKQAGFDRNRFDAVIADPAFYRAVNDVQARATEALGVHATPTLFLNGARYEGALPGEAFDAIVEKLPT